MAILRNRYLTEVDAILYVYLAEKMRRIIHCGIKSLWCKRKINQKRTNCLSLPAKAPISSKRAVNVRSAFALLRARVFVAVTGTSLFSSNDSRRLISACIGCHTEGLHTVSAPLKIFVCRVCDFSSLFNIPLKFIFAVNALDDKQAPAELNQNIKTQMRASKSTDQPEHASNWQTFLKKS